MIALLVTWMDAEDRLAGIIVAAEDAGTHLAIAFSALIRYRSQNLWLLAGRKSCVLHHAMMPRAGMLFAANSVHCLTAVPVGAILVNGRTA